MNSTLIKWMAIASLVLVFPKAWSGDQRVHQYRVHIDKEMVSAKVEVCFKGKAPEYLIVDYRKATKNLIKFPKTKKGFIEYEGRYWKTASLAKNTCFDYLVDISDHNRNLRYNLQETPLTYFSENSWLWLPEKLGEDESVEILFDVPKDYRVSTPWTMLDKKGLHYRLGRSPLDWGFTIVIGQFELKPVKLASGGQINLAILDKVKQKDKLTNWVVDTSDTLADYLGYFPVEQLQVVMIQSRRSKRSPVPWGEVKRGGGFGVILVVASEKEINDFYKDWTITHEFSHLLIPNIQYKDIWLSEGLASYLQYVLMARADHLTPLQTWQRLYDGFGRGLKGTKMASKEQLIDTVKNRRRGGSGGRTKRIYWSGAVYFFLADMQLREATKGQMDLPKLLVKLNQCCINSNKEWSGKTFSEKLDSLSATKIFTQLYQDIAFSEDFPDFETAYSELGMLTKSGKVKFKPDDKKYPLRHSLLFGEREEKELSER